MNNTLKIVSLSMVTALLISGCARPGTKIKEAGGFVGYMFEKMDTNSDGYVDEKEYMTSIEDRFDSFDVQGDNNVTLSDFDASRFAQFVPSVAQNLFEGYDINQDGVVTKEEVLLKERENFKEIALSDTQKFTKSELIMFMKKERFEFLDKNDDGVIVLEEFQESKLPFEQ